MRRSLGGKTAFFYRGSLGGETTFFFRRSLSRPTAFFFRRSLGSATAFLFRGRRAARRRSFLCRGLAQRDGVLRHAAAASRSETAFFLCRRCFRSETAFLSRSSFGGETAFFFRSSLRGETAFFRRSSSGGETALLFRRGSFGGETAFFCRSSLGGQTAFFFRSSFGGGNAGRHRLGHRWCDWNRERFRRPSGDRGVRLVAAAADLDPDVVTTAGRHAVEAIVADVGQPVFDGAEFLERDQALGRQQLRQHAGHHFDRQPVRRDVDRARARHDVRPLTDVHHQRVAIGANNRREKRIN